MDFASSFKKAMEEANYKLLVAFIDMESTYQSSRWLEDQNGDSRRELDKKFDKLMADARKAYTDMNALSRSSVLILERM